MAVTLQMGVDEHTITRVGGSPVVGQRVSGVVRDNLITQIFNLDGRETYEVKSTGGTWRQVDGNYALSDGDQMRFSKASGEKGKLILVVRS